ncbi:uncharacterized protein MYCGRDRAFT_105151, partial [Zymoseptoria tritici IPO323]
MRPKSKGHPGRRTSSSGICDARRRRRLAGKAARAHLYADAMFAGLCRIQRVLRVVVRRSAARATVITGLRHQFNHYRIATS